jgi:hypothetical protein
MKAHAATPVRVTLAALLAASLISPITASAEGGRRDDDRAPARQSQQQNEKARAEQARQAQERAAREKAAREQAARQEKERQERDRRELAQRQEKEREAAARQAKDRAGLGVLNRARDAEPSDHPSGKERNDEKGGSFPQGRSSSNPDGGGVDKPFAADGKAAGSQGRNDFDGNNGCGNDNDFADDNNGNCGGRSAQKKAEVAGVQVTPEKQRSDDRRDDRRDGEHKDADQTKRDDGKREDVRGATDVNKNDDKDRDDDHDKVGVCHATGSATNPFVFIRVSRDGAANGHAKHDGDKIGVASEKDCPAAQKSEVAGVRVDRDEVRHHSFWDWLKRWCQDVASHFNKPKEGVLGTQDEVTPSPTATVNVVPTSTAAPTNTAVPTSTSTPVPTSTNTAVPTATHTPVPTVVMASHECVSTEWHWVINQLDSESAAPAQIRVTWANGNTELVSRTAFSGGVAHYTTTSNLTSPVVSATVVGSLPSGWTGRFNLSHGPCL